MKFALFFSVLNLHKSLSFWLLFFKKMYKAFKFLFLKKIFSPPRNGKLSYIITV